MYPGARPAYRYELVQLDPKYDVESNPVKTIIENEFRGTLKAQRVVENFPRHGFVNAPKGAKFVGAENCKDCHPKTFAKWESTGHSDAFEALLNDPKPDVTYDAEDITVRQYGDTAILAFQLVQHTPGRPDNKFRNSGTFLKRNGKWQVVLWQATPIPDKKDATR